MKVDETEIRWLFDNMSLTNISKLTGLPISNLSLLKKNRIKLENTTIRTGHLLTSLALRLKNKIKKEKRK